MGRVAALPSRCSKSCQAGRISSGRLFEVAPSMGGAITMQSEQPTSAVPPLFVWDGDLLAFDSVEDAERSLEAVDIKDDDSTAFDSLGRRLRLRVRSEREKFLF